VSWCLYHAINCLSYNSYYFDKNVWRELTVGNIVKYVGLSVAKILHIKMIFSLEMKKNTNTIESIIK